VDKFASKDVVEQNQTAIGRKDEEKQLRNERLSELSAISYGWELESKLRGLDVWVAQCTLLARVSFKPEPYVTLVLTRQFPSVKSP
jgi:hypothetical protein